MEFRHDAFDDALKATMAIVAVYLGWLSLIEPWILLAWLPSALAGLSFVAMLFYFVRIDEDYVYVRVVYGALVGGGGVLIILFGSDAFVKIAYHVRYLVIPWSSLFLVASIVIFIRWCLNQRKSKQAPYIRYVNSFFAALLVAWLMITLTTMFLYLLP